LSVRVRVQKVCERNILYIARGILSNLHFGALGKKDELIRFMRLKVKGQDHDWTKYGRKGAEACIHIDVS